MSAEYVATIETLAHVVIELSKGKELSDLPQYVRDAVVWAWERTEYWPDAQLALTAEDKAEIDAAYEESARCQRESWAAAQTDVVGGAQSDGLGGGE